MLTICCSVQLKGRPRIRTIIAAFWLVNRRASGSTPKNTYSNKFRIYYLFELFGKMFDVYDKLMMQIVNERVNNIFIHNGCILFGGNVQRYI